MSQVGAKLGQVGPKLGPSWGKLGQNGPKMGPSWGKMAHPDWHSHVCVTKSQQVSKLGPKINKNPYFCTIVFQCMFFKAIWLQKGTKTASNIKLFHQFYHTFQGSGDIVKTSIFTMKYHTFSPSRPSRIIKVRYRFKALISIEKSISFYCYLSPAWLPKVLKIEPKINLKVKHFHSVLPGGSKSLPKGPPEVSKGLLWRAFCCQK